MENNYSNIIAPSDGVRRFLCKTSVLSASMISLAFSVCAFLMNRLEASTLGGSLRSSVLYMAYILFPLGLLTAAVFARIKSMGLAYSMISLLAATVSSFMLLLNSLASLMREGRLLGISGSLLEFLTFAALFALIVNLVMSCMDFRLQPIIGTVGAIVTVLAMIVTSVRTMLAFSALSFAWKPEFDWHNLSKTVATDKLSFHADWIFRSIPRGNAEALAAMFELRFFERISACIFYCVMIMIFLKFQKEMKAFNKLLEHASEYVDIPTARIYQGIFGSGAKNDVEPVIPVKRSGSSSIRSRLRELSNMTRAKEQGMDISEMADDYDTRRASEQDENRFVSAIQPDDNYSEDDELTEEERYIMQKRRQMQRRRPEESDGERIRSDEFGDDRPRMRRRPDEFGEERPGQRRRPDEFGEERPRQRRRSDEIGEERTGQRRRPDEFGEKRLGQRRRSDESGEERPRRGSQQKRELTDQEKYLMEERRKRQRQVHPDESENWRRR